MDDGLPKVLSDKGAAIVRRGGADDIGKTAEEIDDGMLVLEIAARCPGLSAEDGAAFFIALRTEFGEEALYAIRNGHVQFAKKEQ